MLTSTTMNTSTTVLTSTHCAYQPHHVYQHHHVYQPHHVYQHHHVYQRHLVYHYVYQHHHAYQHFPHIFSIQAASLHWTASIQLNYKDVICRGIGFLSAYVSPWMNFNVTLRDFFFIGDLNGQDSLRNYSCSLVEFIRHWRAGVNERAAGAANSHHLPVGIVQVTHLDRSPTSHNLHNLFFRFSNWKLIWSYPICVARQILMQHWRNFITLT